jgi:hypothetical protein
MTAETPLTRRRLLQSGAALGSLALAGCSGGGSSTPTVAPSKLNGTRPPQQTGTATNSPGGYETVDSDTPTVSVGQVVADDALAFAVQSFSREPKLGEQSPPDGKEFGLLQVGIRNRTTDQFLSFADMRVEIVDGNDKKHDRVEIRSDLGVEAAREQLAPGELARTVLVFTVPTDASKLNAVFEFSMPAIRYETVTVDLSKTSRPIATFDQNLSVTINDIGDTISNKGLSVTLDGVRTADSIDEAGSAGQGREYVIPNLTVENTTTGSVLVVFTEDAGIKDSNGNSFAQSTAANAGLENPLPPSRQIRGKETIDGELAYVVPKGVSPLYFIFDFSVPADGFRKFWQIR